MYILCILIQCKYTINNHQLSKVISKYLHSVAIAETLYMRWEFCIYSVTYFKNNLFAPDDCGSCFSFHRPRRSATILYWRPGMDRCLDERLHSMQPQIAVMWIKERLCGLMRGYVIWRGVFNIRRDWETWREVAKQKESLFKDTYMWREVGL